MTETTNAHVEDETEWSPSDGRYAVRKAIAEARAGIAAGKIRFAERQALIEQRSRKDADR